MYLRSFLTILVLFSCNLIALAQSKNTPQVEINNLQLTYKYFNEIAPTIENKSNRKIYSFNVGWGLQLLRFNETTRQWEKGRLGFRCGLTGLNAATESRHPINPGEKLSLPVNWQLTRGWDEKKDERAFLLADGN